VPGVCDRSAPPRRQLQGGVEVLCHRSEADLVALQPPKTAVAARAA
jgi:peptide/nickel transport system ATP-binding protein